MYRLPSSIWYKLSVCQLDNRYVPVRINRILLCTKSRKSTKSVKRSLFYVIQNGPPKFSFHFNRSFMAKISEFRSVWVIKLCAEGRYEPKLKLRNIDSIIILKVTYRLNQFTANRYTALANTHQKHREAVWQTETYIYVVTARQRYRNIDRDRERLTDTLYNYT